MKKHLLIIKSTRCRTNCFTWVDNEFCHL